jgi:hypothetical protein
MTRENRKRTSADARLMEGTLAKNVANETTTEASLML